MSSIARADAEAAFEELASLHWRGPRETRLSDFEPTCGNIPVVSFFTGCGGMDLGLEAVGYQHTAAFEFNELFCKTLRRNRPTWKVFGPPTHSGDVSKYSDVVNALENLIKKPFDGVFVGGPAEQQSCRLRSCVE